MIQFKFHNYDKLHGYKTYQEVEFSLTARLNIARLQRPDELRKILALNGDSYNVDTPASMMRFVAFLDRPIAVLLDEIGIPRTQTEVTFHELAGPMPYVKPAFSIRRVVPGLIPANEIVVQPMFTYLPELPIMTTLKVLFSLGNMKETLDE